MSRQSSARIGAILSMAFALHLVANAQELEISISPSPVGSGARAAGMADAFVAIADDATAASWNPAGLVQLERPEFSLVGSYIHLFEEFSAKDSHEVNEWHDDGSLDLNFMSFTYPLPFLVFDRNVVVGLYYQHKYNFSRDIRMRWNADAAVNSQGTVLQRFTTFDFEQDGQLNAVTPAIAFELTHRLSFGAGVNLWRSTFLAENGWEQKTRIKTLAQFGGSFNLTDTYTEDTYEDVEGENYTFGLLWNLNDRWSIGARYDTAWTAKAQFRRITRRSANSFDGFLGQFIPQDFREKREIRFPATIALGVACRVNDRLTISTDVSRTDWNDFWFKGQDGQRFSLVTAENFDRLWDAPHFDPTITVRAGLEYVFLPKQPEEELDRLFILRGGLFYDQEPATKHPDDFWGLALGGGLQLNQRVNIDLAYQLRYGRDVNGDFFRGIRGFNEDVFQNRILFSTIIYF